MRKQNNQTSNVDVISKLLIKASLIVVAILASVWLYLSLVIGLPSLLKVSGLGAENVAINISSDIKDYEKDVLSSLIAKNKVMTVENLWSFQSGYYQTIISFLIAIIGILGVIAFFYIKASSSEKAKDSAFKYAHDYVESAQFKKIVEDYINEEIHQIKSDYDETITKIDEMLETLSQNRNQFYALSVDIDELRNHISIIGKRVSKLDSVNTDGRKLQIRMR